MHAAKFIKQEIPVVLAGDYNVAPDPARIYADEILRDKDALIQPKSRAAIPGSCWLQGWTRRHRELKSGTSLSIRSGITSATAGRAMPGCGSIICC